MKKISQKTKKKIKYGAIGGAIGVISTILMNEIVVKKKFNIYPEREKTVRRRIKITGSDPMASTYDDLASDIVEY